MKLTAPVLVVLTAFVGACGGSESPPPAAPPAAATPPAAPPPPEAPAPVASVPDAAAPTPAVPAALSAKFVALPGASSPASLDYIVADRANGRIWVPVGNTGSVDVYDVAKGTFTRVDGFKTAERERHGTKRVVGPSAATLGDGFAFIGNRATNEVCPVNATSLKPGQCLKLTASTDGVSYVAAAKEVWVTTPDAKSIAVLDASHPEALHPKTVIKVEGTPEGYAVDEANGRFFTNLEDGDATLVIDVKTHKVTSTWKPGCGSEGPRGLAFDARRNFLYVACTDHVQVIDAGHEGARLGKLDTGAGVDNLDYLETRGLLYVAAGKAGQMSVVQIDDKGVPSVIAAGATATGARNGVADANGNGYVAESQGARLVVLTMP